MRKDVEVLPQASETAIQDRKPEGIQQSITHVLAQGVANGTIPADQIVATLEAIQRMKHEEEDRHASREYKRAMSGFQTACPIIEGTNEVPDQYGNIKYRYPPLDQIVEKVGPLLEQFGLSYRFEFAPCEGGVSISCIFSHEHGHSERTTVVLPSRVSIPKANEAQGAGGALSYGKRYAFLAASGVAVRGVDDDAQSAAPAGPVITPDQAATIDTMIKDLGANIDVPGMLRYFKCTSVDDLPAAAYAECVTSLQHKIRKMEAAAQEGEK